MKFLFLLLSVLCLPFCKNNDKTTPSIKMPSNEMATLVSDQAEPVTEFPFAVLVKDKNQTIQNTADILEKNGKPTIIMFWLTTCNPCTRELSCIKQNFDSWQQEVPFNLVAISEDREENYPSFIQRVEKELWPFNSYWDFNRSFKVLMPGGLNGLPQTFIFNKKGKLVWQKRGYLRQIIVKL
jgi:thiol-disulfide isomerase/thioredoxin